MNDKLLTFIENSFLEPIIKLDCVTDISYNGVSVFYVHNQKGRMKSDIKISENEAIDFIRQIANFSEKQFSYANPILDVSIGRYRINAVHPSLVRVGNEKSCSFAIRIGSFESKIEKDPNFMSKDALAYLDESLKKEHSIFIAGPTGSGKTELQKFLLSRLKNYSRVIVIDNIQELEYLRLNENLDITSWQISPNNQFGTIQELIKNALRSNPDWLVIAESRGAEMNDVLNSIMTGHPIVTTLHAKNLEDIPNRICRMVEMANPNQKHEDILSDINTHIKTCVFVNREYNADGNVKRYVESIGELQPDGKMKIIYRRKKQ